MRLALYLTDLAQGVDNSFATYARRPLARIIMHWPATLRVVSLLSLHEGRAESIFQEIRRLVLSCSSHDPATYCQDVALRQILATPSKPFTGTDPLQTAYKALYPRKNTSFPIALLRKHLEIWQNFLPNIGDYLRCGKGVWWHSSKTDIVFHDCVSPSDPPGPQLAHFRVDTRTMVEQSVKSDWDYCLRSLSDDELPPLSPRL